MITTSDTIAYTNTGFDGEKYIALQSKAIKERIQKFDGKLYLEIGGKFLHDPHASRVLPGFFADSKKRIFETFAGDCDIIFCMNAPDILSNRPLSSEDISYTDTVESMLSDIRSQLGVLPKISINRVSSDMLSYMQEYQARLKDLGYEAYLRYEIAGYPENIKNIVGPEGYVKDDTIPTKHSLVLVTGAASNSGKMSTCLGQMYHDYKQGIESGYAKYETFPVWDLPLEHPVNLAYEAATADIDDHNMMDPYHEKHYGIQSVNYNRDVEAFEIVMHLAKQCLPESNPSRSYLSPTDMGISMAGACITDESLVKQACLEEIHRRASWYQQMLDRGQGENVWVERCQNLIKKLED
ncbi:DUF1846 domain-containing protein [Candidatus Gracilibacteria bacterium]|nr:DUF1846 domain-containing protein [Candidatus Gracilibacteria bacterium]